MKEYKRTVKLILTNEIFEMDMHDLDHRDIMTLDEIKVYITKNREHWFIRGFYHVGVFVDGRYIGGGDIR